MSEIFYPTKRNKKPKPISLDVVVGYLSPLVYRLNQGKDIKAKSKEHRELQELLTMSNL